MFAPPEGPLTRTDRRSGSGPRLHLRGPVRRQEAAIPDSVGKRKRRDVTARKAAAREERRLARAARRKDRAAGLIESGPPIGPAEQSEWLLPAGGAESEDGSRGEDGSRAEDGSRDADGAEA